LFFVPSALRSGAPWFELPVPRYVWHAVQPELAKIFASSGCTACHTYLGTGSSNQGAPDLSAEGTKGRTKDFFTSYIRDPSKFGNNVMPKFGFDDQQLSQLAAFLSASKGPK